MTAIDTSAASGSRPPSFFNSTMPRAAASRASA
jgi:hypothetical protein